MTVHIAPSVLLVDDRPDKLLALETMLEPLGYHIRKVDSGKKALRLLLTETFHLVILDVNMPDLNGFDTAKLIRQRDNLAELPIVFVSAMDATDADMERGYALGAVDYIHTPVHPAVLRARVSTFVTLRLRTEELQNANAHLLDVNKQMQTFLYTVSHDLRAPLRSIINFTGILLEECGGTLEKGHADLLHRVACSGVRMDELLQDLLQYSQLSRGEFKLLPVDSGNILDGVLQELKSDIEARKAIIEVEGPLPRVQGNAVFLGQVLRNLVDNALKFVSPAVTPKVRIWSIPSGDGVKILVEDNGIGIATEHQQKIFGVFERLHGQKEYPGTGIGLAIVRRVMERMDGEIGLNSAPGKGSCFWIKLPKPNEAPPTEAST